MSIYKALTLETITCSEASCGITFAVPDVWHEKRRNDHSNFYCPNGHALCFAGKSVEEKLRAQNLRLESELEFERSRLARAQAERRTAQTAAKRETTRRKNLQKRAEAGVCAHCHRTFQNVAAHVASRHGTPEQRRKRPSK